MQSKIKRTLPILLSVLVLLMRPNDGVYAQSDAQKPQIVFTSDRDNGYGIYAMDADGKNISRIINDSAENGSPTWSPDRKQIAYVSRRDGNPQIYVADADGKNQRRLSDQSLFSAGNPAWSPDGQSIVFSASGEKDGNGMYLVSPDG
ncbi:MAG TPA: hypothetical protein VMT34_11495, partial [Aggregatilineales bacterium]|nr:hypothetical protein [Aggregatilineales bacterium]